MAYAYEELQVTQHFGYKTVMYCKLGIISPLSRRLLNLQERVMVEVTKILGIQWKTKFGDPPTTPPHLTLF